MALSKRHQDLLDARGLDLELLERLGVETCEKRSGDWVSIAYLDRGERVNEKVRTISGEKRFYQDAGKKPIFWNIDCLRDESLATQPLVVTEGEFDAIAAIQAGFVRTVSVPNGAPAEEVGKDDTGTRYAFLADAKPLLKDCKEIILATDGDPPGIALMNDLAVRLGKARCKWVRYPKGCKDLNDALAKFGPRGVVETLNRAQWVKVSGVYRMSELPPIYQPPAYPIGIVGLDRHYKIRLGDLAVLVGIPGHGKTSWLNEVAGRMATDYGWVCAFASFEQRPQHDHKRSLRTFRCRKSATWQTAADIAQADKWIEDQFVFIVPDDEDEPTVEWLIERIQAAVVQHGAKLVVIDPWNELEHQRPAGMSETEYTGISLAQIRRLAQRLNCHIIVATHPTKLEAGKDGKLPKPTLYSASGSANWANKPEVGLVIYRDGADTVLDIQKVRYHDEIGEPGSLNMIFLRDQGRFEVILDPTDVPPD
jgi:twinkle protein